MSQTYAKSDLKFAKSFTILNTGPSGHPGVSGIRNAGSIFSTTFEHSIMYLHHYNPPDF